MAIQMMSGYPVGGWLLEQENRFALNSLSTDLSGLLQGTFQGPAEVDPRGMVAASFMDSDPRPDVTVEDQGQQGSCQGHALSSVCEFCYFIATGGQRVEFSRAYGYYGSQKIDGINGDRGSTLDGGRRLVTEKGIPLESVWPYPPKYNNQPPGGWEHQYEAAAANKIQSHTVMKSGEDCKKYIGLGIGGIEIGISWGGNVNSQGVFQWSPSGGGHALCFLGYTTINGIVYFWMLNSWTKKWGLDGWALVPITTVDQMLRDRSTVMIGLSDMSAPEPRAWDFVKDSMYW